MTLIKWRDSYSTGIIRFDNDHKKIIQLINKLYEEIRDKKEGGDMGQFVEELISYTRYHFTTEEEFMRLSNYPHLDDHARMHEAFTVKIQEIHNRLRHDQSVLAREIYSLLREWFITHIMEEDMLYGPFFKDKGVE